MQAKEVYLYDVSIHNFEQLKTIPVIEESEKLCRTILGCQHGTNSYDEFVCVNTKDMFTYSLALHSNYVYMYNKVNCMFFIFNLTLAKYYAYKYISTKPLANNQTFKNFGEIIKYAGLGTCPDKSLANSTNLYNTFRVKDILKERQLYVRYHGVIDMYDTYGGDDVSPHIIIPTLLYMILNIGHIISDIENVPKYMNKTISCTIL